ncbi:MAG: anthranilate synthase component I [Bacteroidetes bacterium]|jgi:anthranilate synthase component 1|nr:MAG: anthranilate synthase component I [Bacteroidota bacterium]
MKLKKFEFTSTFEKVMADTLTPVSVYLKLRDHFPGSILLESSDYHTNDNSFSYICCKPIASISVHNEKLTKTLPDQSEEVITLSESSTLLEQIDGFSKQFIGERLPFKFITNGWFGYTSYDSVRYFENLPDYQTDKPGQDIPDIYYALYQNIIAIDHFKNEAYLICHSYNDSAPNIEEIKALLAVESLSTYPYKNLGEKEANISDEAFKDLVVKAKEHCKRGDVFQLVLSRQTSQAFQGDEFNVYRALRSVNPSPYLFYFDYINFKLFGSSPEAQLIVQEGQAEIHPIAGTYKRTGDDEKDAELAKKLAADPKENAEHVMLVDLARNDLSRNGHAVEVKTYREVQFFSHVIHLVSKVTAKKTEGTSTLQLMADTFPAGTLSGAPKPMALKLIDKYEATRRGFYGGAIGFFDFDGNYNHAILIRSFLSKNNKLYYQAGAGIVASSDEESELQETYNKLGALQKALELAENLR